jgi:hypothetical protein
MKRLLAITVVVLLSSAMLFVVVSEGAGLFGGKFGSSIGAAAGPVEKPSKGMWTGTIYLLGPCTDPAFPPEAQAVQAINIGKGVFTHTGKSNFLSSYCSYFTSETSAEASGWAILTGENGDAIHLSIEITLDLSVRPPRWTEIETVVGGTGRFEGAIGESFSEGTWNLGTNPFPYNLNGSADEIPPKLFQEPQGWVGTTEGWIKY